ncbi:MAG: hypothetical protein ACRDGK_01405 [Actinomycetota bacterium]
MDRSQIFEAAGRRLLAARNGDGGFGPGRGAPSEPEPTALAAIALDDDAARRWLIGRQRDDGSFGVVEGFARDEGATGLAAIAAGPGAVREHALDRLEELEAEPVPQSDAVPLDGSIRGWPWVGGTAGWVEPTARSLLALRLFRPGSPRIAEAVAYLRDRRCVGGGWNYGNRVVLDEVLPPFAQTTAAALLGLHGLDDALEREGAARLRGLWRRERAGCLSVAFSLAVFRIKGERDEAAGAAEALADVVTRTDLLADPVSAAWAAIAAGPGVHALRSP